MKIISKMLVGALALAVTNVYAAELIQPQQQHCINKDVHNGKIPAPVKSGR